MSSTKFSQMANKVVATAGLELSAQKAAAAASTVLYEKDIDTMAARMIPRLNVTRTITGVPKNAGEVAPTLDQFDPLNPGNWQVGAAGKILPRLPEGTKCGNLVMGKYGLYSPSLRKRVEAYSNALDHGSKSENCAPFDRGLSVTAKALAYACAVIALWNAATLIYGKPLPPFQDHKAPGSA
uniref:SCP domain-containing protein n=1 Tax=Rhabditophanes sp. KR3021 TaxID=114890 RepID=A0AC35TVZ9_9BILA